MRAFILSLVAVFSLSAFAAELLACPVEGCGIDASLHAVTTTPADVEVEAWSWLAHDLALARLALAEGDNTTARELAQGAHVALRTHAGSVRAERGLAFVTGMHLALAEVIVRAGGAAPPALASAS